MPENAKPNNERPADLAVQDSVGGMARRLLNPAHLRDLAGRSVRTLREQGAEQLWRDVKFRVVYAKHLDEVKAAMDTDDKNVRDAALLPIMDAIAAEHPDLTAADLDLISYKDRDGNNRTAIEIVANNANFAGSKSTGGGSNSVPAGGSYNEPTVQYDEI